MSDFGESVEKRRLDVRFIQAYESMPVLWNPSLRFYKNKQKRIQAQLHLLSILREVEHDASLKSVHRKINYLRSLYIREEKRIKERGQLYQPSWKYQLLSFLSCIKKSPDTNRFSESELDFSDLDTDVNDGLSQQHTEDQNDENIFNYNVEIEGDPNIIYIKQECDNPTLDEITTGVQTLTKKSEYRDIRSIDKLHNLPRPQASSSLKMDEVDDSDEDDLEFIMAYKKLPILWNSSLKEYKKRSRRIKAHRKLLEVLRKKRPEATIETVRKKINSIRTIYTKETKKIKESGEARWPNRKYGILRFLDDVYRPSCPGVPHPTESERDDSMDSDSNDTPSPQHTQDQDDEYSIDIQYESSFESSKQISNNSNVEETIISAKNINDNMESRDVEKSHNVLQSEASLPLSKDVLDENYHEVRFIMAYKSLPVLWNPALGEYSVRGIRFNALQKLLNVLKINQPNATLRTVRSKINSLRTSYSSERRKIKDRGKMYQPNWKYQILRFLEDIKEPICPDTPHQIESGGDNSMDPIEFTNAKDAPSLRHTQDQDDENSLIYNIDIQHEPNLEYLKQTSNNPVAEEIITNSQNITENSESQNVETVRNLSQPKALLPLSKAILDEKRDEVQFIMAYKNLPVLWNPDLEEYSVKGLRFNALRKLLAILKTKQPNATLTTVRNKINCLRTIYLTEKKKIKERGKMHTPNWKYHILRFLDDVKEPMRPDRPHQKEPERNDSMDPQLTQNEEVQFIMAYKNLPVLWNYALDEYTDQSKRLNALHELLAVLKKEIPYATLTMVRRRINCIRSCYLQEKRKLKHCGWLKRWSSWKFRLLRFLDDVKKPVHPNDPLQIESNGDDSMDTSKNINVNDISSSQDTPNIKNFLIDNIIHQGRHNIDPLTALSDHMSYTNPNNLLQIKSEINDSMDVNTSFPLTKKIFINNIKENEELQKQNNIQNVTNNSETQDDEFGLFCKSLAEQLRKFPVDRAVICMERLQSVMTQERLRQLQC